MAKRGYKLQEFVAHSTNVNCLNIGKKTCRLFITGGDDHKVNLWAIGKPSSLMSLCGHSSPVESASFDASEVLVLAGASAGAIKLWDLEEAKMVRTLTGHRFNCSAVEFHPFGEFFASGSMDTNLKIWDIRKKGCIHTYKGHTRGISTIKFTPDGRWVVSGGLDNIVKVWDLTAGKLLHDFKFHEGHIRSIDFHPLEFLLATGSADRTVKFWDLETFELIGSTIPEATGVRSISFHPDGRTLFCGLDDSLKIYSWEPIISHDAVDMGWSTLGDLCIHDGKLLGCSYYRNSVGVWVADISLIEPYGVGFVPEESDGMQQKLNAPCSRSSDKVGSGARTTSGFRSRSPDYETKEIKNIYVDTTSGNPVDSKRAGSLSSPKVVLPKEPNETSDVPIEKQSTVMVENAKQSGQVLNKSFVVPIVVPRDSPDEKDPSDLRKETITFSRTKPGMLLRPAHARRPSNSKNDVEKLSVALESGIYSNVTIEKESGTDLLFQTQTTLENVARKSYEEKSSNMKSVTERFEKISSPEKSSDQENCDESVNSTKGVTSVKIVNGVAVVAGRTRTLVERFERRERSSNEDQATNETHAAHETNRISSIVTPITPCVKREADRTPIISANVTPTVMAETDRTPFIASNVTPPVMPETDRTPIIASNVTPIIASVIPEADKTATIASNMTSRVIPQTDRTPVAASNMIPSVIPEIDRMPIIENNMTRRIAPDTDRTSTTTTTTTNLPRRRMRQMDRTAPVQKEEPQISGRESTTANYEDVTEILMQSTTANHEDVTEVLMQSHDVFLSSLKSRLTKLQVVRHFWERNDTKGAINALRKLPDHSVQADVISLLMEKLEIFTLDLFSCLLPVLVGLLESKMERHASVSLEMLLKLVAVFGPVIRSTISAPPSVGVDLHAEQRLECCKQCFVQLQKIQQILPALVRTGGMLAKSALELNLVLQAS